VQTRSPKEFFVFRFVSTLYQTNKGMSSKRKFASNDDDEQKKQPVLIMVSGKMHAGKSELATRCTKKLSKILGPKETVELRSMAGELKKDIARRLNVPLESLYTSEGKNQIHPKTGKSLGTALQDYGEMMRRTLYEDIWVDTFFSSDPAVHKICQDGRHPNEADAFKRFPQGIVVRVNGDPSGEYARDPRDKNHISEIALDNYKHFDLIYENNGTLDDLDHFADRVIALALKKREEASRQH